MSNTRSGRVLASEPAVHEYIVRLLGTGASVPTKSHGSGITVTRTGVGVYRLTWTDNPLTILGASYCFAGATPADLKGYTMTRSLYTAATQTMDIYVWNSSFAAADLAATQVLDLVIRFKEAASDV
jgi:hypothetical protein